MRAFYLAYADEMSRTLSGKFDTKIPQTASVQSELAALTTRLPLPWSHYVLLVRRSRSPETRAFYETEAVRGGWTVRQLQRHIDTQFYERTALSKTKAAMLAKGAKARPQDAVAPEEEIKDPLVLEFLGLKDECSESDLEGALVQRIEQFLLELGGDFAFVGRQRRLRVGNAWYRVDLLFFHRALRCLVVIDLKLGELTHADAGQMHLYLNYARALDAAGREPAGWSDPLRREGRRDCEVRARGIVEQGARSGISDHAASGEAARPRDG